MAYTKNEDPWSAEDLITAAIMDNFETIYTECSTYLSTHLHDDLYQTKAEMEAAYWYAGNDGSGSGADADLIYKASGNLHAASFSGLGVDTGLIILWYGSTGSIPAGWHLCDGTGGTIDLRNRFPVGAGSTYEAGDTGGSATFAAAGSISVSGHSLSVAEMAAHVHPFLDWTPTYHAATGVSQNWICQGTATTSGATASAGSGDAHGHSTAEGTHFDGDAVASLPFCLALCYIQKIAA